MTLSKPLCLLAVTGCVLVLPSLYVGSFEFRLVNDRVLASACGQDPAWHLAATDCSYFLQNPPAGTMNCTGYSDDSRCYKCGSSDFMTRVSGSGFGSAVAIAGVNCRNYALEEGTCQGGVCSKTQVVSSCTSKEGYIYVYQEQQ